MEKIKGRNMLLWIDGFCVAGNTECSLTVTRDTIEVASPSQGDYKAYRPARLSWEMSTTNLIIFDDDDSGNSNKELFVSGISSDIWVQVSFSLADDSDAARLPGSLKSNGKFGFTGDAIITQMAINAQNGNRLKGTFKFQGSGALS